MSSHPHLLRKSLNKNKIYTIGELVNYTEYTLSQIEHIGKVTLAKIKSALAEYGYELKSE